MFLILAMLSWRRASAQPQQLAYPNPKSCGDPVDIYKNVQSLWNGDHKSHNCKVVLDKDGNPSELYGMDGLEYECVEFVRRFYRLAKGCDSTNGSCNTANWAGKGNAADYYVLASSFGLEAHKNSADTKMPQPDDILSYSGGSVCSKGPPVKYCGHVNIIKRIVQASATTWNVYVIEQNVQPSATQKPLTLTQNVDSTYTLNDSRFGKMTLAVQGWLRPPTAVTVTATLDGQPYVGPVQFTILVPPSGSGVVSIFGQAVPNMNSNMPAGSYTLFNVSGGPPNSTLIGVGPCAGPLVTSCMAPLATEETLDFALQFASNPPSNIVYSQTSYIASPFNYCDSGIGVPTCAFLWFHDNSIVFPGQLDSITLKMARNSSSYEQNIALRAEYGSNSCYSSYVDTFTAVPSIDTWTDVTFVFTGCVGSGSSVLGTIAARTSQDENHMAVAYNASGQPYIIVRAH